MFTVSDDEPLASPVQPRKKADEAIGSISKMIPRARGVSSRMSLAGRNHGKRGSERMKTATSKRKQKVGTELDSESGGVSRLKSAKHRSRQISLRGLSGSAVV